MRFWKKNKNLYKNLISPKAADYFISESVQAEYIQKGFVIIPDIIPESVIDELKELTNYFLDEVQKEFAYSTMICSQEENMTIHQLAGRAVKSVQEKLFKQFKAYSSTFLIKPALSLHEMDLHQDWSFTDERNYVPVTFWVPLQDVTDENGAVFVLPGSHRIYPNRRSHSLPTARIPRASILKQNIKTAVLKKGDLLLFNPAAFHGSHGNRTNNHRIAFTMTIMPQAAPLLYYEKLNDTQVEVLSLDEHALLTQMKTFNETEQVKGRLGEVIAYQHHIPTAQEIKQIWEKTS